MPKSLELDLQLAGSAAALRRIRLEPSLTPLIIGSSQNCAVHVDGPVVEPEHAELFCDGEHWCVRDRASGGGTFLDENRLFVSAIRLEVGQCIRLGIGGHAGRLMVIAGAAAARDGVDLTAEVSGFVKQQKRERRKRMRRWAIALPSAGMMLILSLWGVGAIAVTRDQADRRAHPERYANEEPNAGFEKLAAIMSGEAKPEDVDVNEIIAAASFGRTSKLADAAMSLVRPGVVSASPTVTPIRTRGLDARAANANHAGSAAAGVDERSLAATLAQRSTADAAHRAAIEVRVVEESQIVTLRRLRTMLDERQRLTLLALEGKLSASDLKRLMDLDARLSALGVDATKLGWAAGEDIDALGAKLDPAVLEKIRQRLVAAMSK